MIDGNARLMGGRQGREVGAEGGSLVRGQFLGDGAHDNALPASRRKAFELRIEIVFIEVSQARSVLNGHAFARHAVARRASRDALAKGAKMEDPTRLAVDASDRTNGSG
jgi:hypothetical protein